MPDEQIYLKPKEASALLHVPVKVLAKWSDGGYITAWFTTGGHRRYLTSELRGLLDNGFPGPVLPDSHAMLFHEAHRAAGPLDYTGPTSKGATR